MTTVAHPAWLEALRGLVNDLRTLELKIENDTHLEPAPTTSSDQLHSSLWSRTRITSRGRVLAEAEYSGCVRVRFDEGSPRQPVVHDPAAATATERTASDRPGT